MIAHCKGSECNGARPRRGCMILVILPREIFQKFVFNEEVVS